MTRPAGSGQIAAKAREPWPAYLPADGIGAIGGILNLWIRAFESSPSADEIREASAIVDDLVAHERQSLLEECAKKLDSMAAQANEIGNKIFETQWIRDCNIAKASTLTEAARAIRSMSER